VEKVDIANGNEDLDVVGSMRLVSRVSNVRGIWRDGGASTNWRASVRSSASNWGVTGATVFIYRPTERVLWEGKAARATVIQGSEPLPKSSGQS
jgi:hypothetical protein